jgi:hypothetical protein
MGVVTTKSSEITNRDATPRVLNPGRVSGGRVHHARAAAAIANGDSSTSKYIFFQVPSNAVPLSCRVSAPDIGTTTVGHFGLYKTTADGGAVVDADFFKASVSLKDGAIAKSEIVNGNVVTLANANKPIWDHLGLTADPGIFYDVVLTLTADADAAGSVQVELDYTV